MTSEYTQLDAMRQSDGKDGRSPVAELKLIKYDAFVDADHIERAMQTQGRSWIRGDLTQENYSIMKYDVCLAWSLTKQWRTAKAGEETTLRVFSVINGMGMPGEGRLALLSRLRFAGFAGTGTREDSTGQAPKRDLPVVIGGLYNAWNTGAGVINAGDWVYWDLPENNEEILRIQGGKYNQGRPRNRFLVLLKAYNPHEQTMNVEMLRYVNVDMLSQEESRAAANARGLARMRLMQREEGRANTRDRSALRGEQTDWAIEYAQSARELMYLGALMAASGIFGDLPGARNLGPVAQDQTWINSMKERLGGEAAYQDFALSAAQGLGLAEETRNSRRADLANPAMVANRLIFPTSNSDRIVNRTVPRRNERPKREPLPATLAAQQSAVLMNLRAGEEVRWFTKGRIIGKAQENVGPGSFFDIQVGSYAI